MKDIMEDYFLIPVEELIMDLLDWEIVFWNLVIEIFKKIINLIQILSGC